VPKEYEKKLQEIAKVGLCRYYRPMPAELEQTTSPVRVVSEKEYAKQMKLNETAKHKTYPITKDRQEYLLEKYGKDNWYDWAYVNWGTKWGCYDNECDDGTYGFTSAWGPIDDSIILEHFVKDIPTFSYSYEEEQGWGAEFEFEDGEETNSLEWDLPDWEDTDSSFIFFLPQKYQNGEGTHLKGYYSEYNLNEYLGDNFEEATKQLLN
tara:strand:- start:4910 stop:5533 length:624 start_codon:yes stop_codon:yes gene_type:complete